MAAKPRRHPLVRRHALPGRHVDLPVARAGLRLHRADPVLGRHAPPATTWSRSRSAAAPPAVARSSWDVVAPLGGRRQARAPYLRRRPGRRPREVNVDTWQTTSAAGLSDWQVRVTLFRRPGKRGAGPSTASAPWLPGSPTSPASRPPRPGVGAGVELAGPALLADDPPRPLPPVGQRRRGLVLPDVDLDGARLLRRAAAPLGVLLGAVRPRRTRGWTTPRGSTYDNGVRRHRELAVQHGVRRHPDRPRLRHPAAEPARGRAVHQGRHPAGRVDLVRQRRARRRTDRLHQRPPGRDPRLHRWRERDRQRPGREHEHPGPAGLRPRDSSRTSGCPSPAGWCT